MGKKALFVATIAGIILSYGINAPFAGHHDWNSVFFGSSARNTLRFGLSTTKFGVALSPTSFYTHHPILLTNLLALSFAIFGVTEWAGRLVPIISTSVLVFFLVMITQKFWNTKISNLTAFFLIVPPMLFYYSKIPVHETVVLGFIGLTLWAYLNNHYRLAIAGLVLSQLTSWAGFYLSLYLPLHSLLIRKKFVISLFLVAPIMFALFSFHIYILKGPDVFVDLFDAFLYRLNATPAAQIIGFSWPKFITQTARWLVIHYTRILSIGGALWIIHFVKNRLQRLPISDSESFIMLLFTFGITHPFIFHQQAYIHEYTLVYLAPFFALTTAIIVAKLPTPIIAIVLVLVATERLEFVQALMLRAYSNPGHIIGKTVNQLTRPDDKILILSTEFMSFHDVFINFYADRQLSTSDSLTLQDSINYDYIIIPKINDYVKNDDKLLLYTSYPNRDTPQAIIFTTKSDE